MFAPYPRLKVLVKLFQKLAGLGRAHKKRRFLFAKLFLLRLLCQKKKRYNRISILFFIRKKLLKRKLPSPTPPSSKNFAMRIFLFSDIVRSTAEQLMFAPYPRLKVLVKLFQKLAGLGRAHKKRRFLFAKLFLLRLLCQKKKRYNRISILFFIRKNFLKEAFLPPRKNTN